MHAGELRHYLELLSRAQAPAGGAGGTGLTDSYTVVATVSAKIETLQGGRYVAGRQVDEVATHRITIRHRGDYATGAWRYLREAGGTRRYEVKSGGDPDGRRQWLVLNVEEVSV